ncbi:MAG: autotransporter-associated beta strand repeat-containing protein [Chthoniobacterales bacterium]|nr:autotransporter-associated beta strand repeat-containing protein [Chthoniobacterales bacterium]
MGGKVSGAGGGSIHFLAFTDLESAELIANDSSSGAGGARIFLVGKTHGGAAQLKMFGSGAVDISGNISDIATGSIEGDGTLFLGQRLLSVGHNTLSTTFSGVIQDGGASGGGGGALRKVGTSTLTLSGANTYTGGTIVEGGTLVLDNRTGSGTGPSVVQVNSGTLGRKRDHRRRSHSWHRERDRRLPRPGTWRHQAAHPNDSEQPDL